MCPNAPQASRLSAKGPTSGGRIPLGALGARTTPTRAGFLQKDRPVAVESHWGLGVPEQPPREPAFGRRTDQWRSMPTGGWGCPNNPHTSRHSAKGPTSGGRAPLGAGGARTTPKRAGIPLTAGFGCLEEPGTKKLPLPRFVLGCPHMGTFGMLGYLPLIPVFGCL